MWTSIKRLLRHRLARGWRHYLSEAAMQRLTAQVADSEKTHSGEIRICIESRLPASYLWRSEPMRVLARQRAMSQYGKLRVWDTAHNNGVLVYLLLPERCIELVADRGVHARVGSDGWTAIVSDLGRCLQAGQFEAGLSQAVAQVSAILATHFPLAAGETNPNELPDRPSVDEAQ